MLVLPLLSLLGCTQHDADVQGEYFVWLAANSSPAVGQGLVNLDGATHIECVRGWNEEEGDWDLGYIGPREGEVKEGGDWADTYIGGDCAPTDDDCLAVIDELQAPCEQIEEMQLHRFLQLDGFYAFREDLDPWRTEVVINSEGDFQLAFHNRLDAGEDFRVVFSIAPDFAPIECTTDDDGNTVARYVDGDVWLDAWSADQPDIDGTIYYLNAFSVQLNPNNAKEYWYLPSQWIAGMSAAKYSSEDFWSHPPDYGVYNDDGSYTDFVIDHTKYDNDDPDDIAYYEQFVQAIEDLTHGGEFDDKSPLTYDQEITEVAGAHYTDGTEFTHRVEGNLWRPVDNTVEGLDGWAEVHSSWVILDKGSDLEEGGHASGSFQILFDGAQSASALLVHGTFDTDKIKADPWGYDDLQEQLRDESNMPFCEGLQPE
jgi:hypothetical protein